MDRYSVSILDDNISEEIFSSPFKEYTSVKTFKMKKYISVISVDEKSMSMPKYNTQVEAMLGVRSHNYIFKGVCDAYTDNILMVIQIEKLKSGNMYTGEYFGYTTSDDLKFNLLANLLSIKISELKKTAKSKTVYKRSREIIRNLTKLATEKFYPSLLLGIQKLMPEYFEFSKSFVLLYNQEANELSLFDESVGHDNKNNIFRYIANCGLTVEAIHKKKIIISHLGSKDAGFSSDTDNVSRYLQILNMACLPLLDDNKNVVAVMQLINKNRGEINDKDRRDISELQTILGTLIKHIYDYNKALDLTVDIQSMISKMISRDSDSQLYQQIQFDQGLSGLYSMMKSLNDKLCKIIEFKETAIQKLYKNN